MLADDRVVVGADGGDLLHLLLLGQLLGHALQGLDDGLDGLVDAALDGHRVGAGGDVAQAFLIDGQGQDGRGGGAVAGHVAGLLGDGVDELGAHVLERVGQVDFLGDGDAVLGDGRAAEGLVDDDVAPGRPEGDADGVGQLLGAGQQLLAGVVGVEQLFCHVRMSPKIATPALEARSEPIDQCRVHSSGSELVCAQRW